MKKSLPALPLLIAILLISGCASGNPVTAPHPGTTDPLANNAYDVIVAAKGYLDSEKSQHPECSTMSSDVCGRISQAVGAKDLLIDALQAYCSGANFLNGGVCDPLAKGTPAATQVTAKLQAALSNYNAIAADLKKSTGGN